MSTTRTIGYFNANPWPVSVFIRQTGESIMLGKGQYLCNPNGDRVTDPYFDAYKGLLTREEDKAEHQVVPFRLETPVSTSEDAGFGGTSDMTKVDQLISEKSHAPDSKIKVYTAEQARSHHFIAASNDTDEIFDKAPKDSGNGKVDDSPVGIYDLVHGNHQVSSKSDKADSTLSEIIDDSTFSIKSEEKMTVTDAYQVPDQKVKPAVVPNVKIPTVDDIKKMEDNLPIPSLDESKQCVWNNVTYKNRAEMMYDLRLHHPDQVQGASEKYPAANRKKR